MTVCGHCGRKKKHNRKWSNVARVKMTCGKNGFPFFKIRRSTTAIDNTRRINVRAMSWIKIVQTRLTVFIVEKCLKFGNSNLFRADLELSFWRKRIFIISWTFAFNSGKCSENSRVGKITMNYKCRSPNFHPLINRNFLCL